MKNIRTLIIYIFISCVFLLSGCSGLSEKTEKIQNKLFTVNGSVSLQEDTRVAARVAYPDFDFEDDITWAVAATFEDNSVPSVLATCKEDGSFSVVLTAEGKWKFYAIGTVNDKTVLQSVTPVEVNAKEQEEDEAFQISIKVYPLIAEGETGSINLSFRNSAAEDFQLRTVKYAFTDEAVESGVISFNTEKIADFRLQAVPAGIHKVLFEFYGEDERKVYEFKEYIIVFAGVETNTWQLINTDVTESDNIDYSIFEITNHLLRYYDSAEGSDFIGTLEYPIVLWNWLYNTDSSQENYEPTKNGGTWSTKLGYAVFNQISENIGITNSNGVVIGKNVRDFCFDAKTGKIYASEKVDGTYFLRSYPSYTGYSSGKYIPTGVSEIPACVYDGSVWFVSEIENCYRISKLKNGTLQSYMAYDSSNEEIMFSSQNGKSLKLCADSEYLYALYIEPLVSEYLVNEGTEWEETLTYRTDYNFKLIIFSISDSDRKLRNLANITLSLTNDLGFAPLTEEQEQNHQSILSSDFKVSDFMLIQESDNTTALYALFCESYYRGGIVKFESIYSGDSHTLELKPIDNTPDASPIYGWWKSETVASDIELLKTTAQEADDADCTHNAQFHNTYNLGSQNPFRLTVLDDAVISDYLRTEWESDAQYYGEVDESAVQAVLDSMNVIIARIRNAANGQTVMFAPQKFIARKPDELVIAEESSYGGSGNINRVYSLNLRTLSVTKTNVNVSFNSHINSDFYQH